MRVTRLGTVSYALAVAVGASCYGGAPDLDEPRDTPSADGRVGAHETRRGSAGDAPAADAERDAARRATDGSDGSEAFGPDTGRGRDGDDALDVPCTLEAQAASFAARVRPHLDGCSACHDATVAPGALKAPGPPWYHPTDDEHVVGYLADEGLVDVRAPEQSRFLRKPLATADGGIEHTGGPRVHAGTAAYEGFVGFLRDAAPCVQELGDPGR